jgi:hypothetical protein
MSLFTLYCPVHAKRPEHVLVFDMSSGCVSAAVCLRQIEQNPFVHRCGEILLPDRGFRAIAVRGLSTTFG